MKKYHQYREVPSKLLKTLSERVLASPYRQYFHVEGNMGYINDPNGVCFFDGKYHLFYQWSPLAYSDDEWFQGWYHLISDDMIVWEDAGIGIQTDTIYETHGAYSGSALVDNGKMIIFYTGNTRVKNNQRIPYQIIALMDNEGHLSKVTPPAIIDSPQGYTDHFRDPKIWKGNDGHYYAVIGAQRDNKTGTSLVFESNDVFEWNMLGEIGTGYTDFGYMWECPNYFEIDDKGILIFSPQGLEAEGNHYQNIYQTGYIVGSPISRESLALTSDQNFVELDRGFDFYAAQVLQHEGRTILFAWMGLPETTYPTEEYGYCGCLTMPRELFMIENKLYQKPLSELDNYRKKMDHKRIDFYENGCDKFETGFKANLQIQISNSDRKGKVVLDLAASKDAVKTTKIIIDYEKAEIILDRSKSGEGLTSSIYGTKRVIFEGVGEKIDLDIYIDQSSIEIFVNEGQEVASSRIFPGEEQVFTHVTSHSANTSVYVTYYKLVM